MYFVKYGNRYLHDPRVGLILPSAKLSTEINKSDVFTFEITPDNEYYNLILERSDDNKISIYNNDKLIFRGEITSISQNFIGTKTVTCNDELSYLNNILIRPHATDKKSADLVFPKKPKEYVERLIYEHNKRSAKQERFILDKDSLEWMDKLDDLSIIEDSYSTVSDLLSTYILELYNCHIKMKYEGSSRIISIHKTELKKAVREIDFGYNLLDYTKEINTENVCSYVIPYGASINADSYEIKIDTKPEPTPDPYPNIYDIDSVSWPSKNENETVTCVNNGDGSFTVTGTATYIGSNVPVGKIHVALKRDTYYLFKAILKGSDAASLTGMKAGVIAFSKPSDDTPIGWTPLAGVGNAIKSIPSQTRDEFFTGELTVMYQPAARVKYTDLQIYYMVVELPYYDEKFMDLEYKRYSPTGSSGGSSGNNPLDDKLIIDDDPKEKIQSRVTLSEKTVPLLQKAYDYNLKAKNDAYERYEQLISDPQSKQSDIDQAIKDYVEALNESQTNSNYLEDAKINTVDRTINNSFVKQDDMVYSPEAVKRFGWVGKSIDMDDEYSVGRLLRSAIETLKQSETFITAIDVKAIDVDFMTTNKYEDTIKIGDSIKVVSKPHDVDITMMCVDIEYDLVNPSNNTFSLGKTLQTYTSGITKKNIDVKKLIQIVDKKADKIDIESWRRARRIKTVQEETDQNKQDLKDFKEYYQGVNEETQMKIRDRVTNEVFSNLDQYSISNFSKANSLFQTLWNKVFGTDPPFVVGNDRYEKDPIEKPGTDGGGEDGPIESEK